MTEAEYWSECKLLSTEINDVFAVFYTYEEINRLALDDKKILEALDADALFWNTQVNSLQTNLFIILGRIFDRGDDAHSIYKVLEAAINHGEYFSREALLARRTALGGPKPEWLDEFIAQAWLPDSIVIARLRDNLEPYAKRFADTYRPIRTKFFAHKLLNSSEVVSALFGKTNRKELEEIVLFLKNSMDAIEDLYLNGREPKVGTRKYESDREQITKSVRSVLGKLVIETA